MVITIIVLLILAGITIGTLSSDNGVIKQAQTAKDETQKDAVEEQIDLSIIKAEENNRNTTLEDVIEELKKDGIISDDSQVNPTTGAITTNSNYVIEGKLDDYINIDPCDINGDGVINTEDALLIQKHMAGLVTLEGEELERADVNKDGRITVADAIEVQKQIATENQDKYGCIQENGLGDVNDDGKITTADAIEVQSHIGGLVTLTEEQQKRADTDKDGQITTNDAIMIQEYIANI